MHTAPYSTIFANRPFEFLDISKMKEESDSKLKFEAALNAHGSCILNTKLVREDGAISVQRTIIDTGSYYCFISSSVAKALNIPFTGEKVKANAIGQEDGEFDTVILWLVIEEIDPLLKIKFRCCVSTSVFHDVHLLLGTEFLQSFLFEYNNPKGKFSISLILPHA